MLHETLKIWSFFFVSSSITRIEGQTVEIKLQFQIQTAYCGRCLIHFQRRLHGKKHFKLLPEIQLKGGDYT